MCNDYTHIDFTNFNRKRVERTKPVRELQKNDRLEILLNFPATSIARSFLLRPTHRTVGIIYVLTDIGIYHGNLSFGTRERVVCDETFMYFHDDEDMEEDIPISIAMTGFTFFFYIEMKS